MNYTQNLELPLWTDSDAFQNFLTQCNETNNKLEELLGAYIDDVENLPSLQQTVTEQGATIVNHTDSISNINRALTNLGDSISALQNTLTPIAEKKLGVIFNRTFTSSFEYALKVDSLFPIVVNHSSGLLEIANNAIKFKESGKYRINVRLDTLLGNEYQSISEIGTKFSRLLLLENPTLQNEQYIQGVEHGSYTWENRSCSVSFDISINDSQLNVPFYLVLRALGYSSYSSSNETNSCMLSIEKIG